MNKVECSFTTYLKVFKLKNSSGGFRVQKDVKVFAIVLFECFVPSNFLRVFALLLRKK
jgi:hypothetical protein